MRTTYFKLGGALADLDSRLRGNDVLGLRDDVLGLRDDVLGLRE